MFNNTKLENYYSLSAPIDGGTSEMNLITNYDNSVTIDNFYINEDIEKAPVEFFSVYSTGLVIFFRQTSTLIEIYSNHEFEMNVDGSFVLIPF